VPVVAESPDSRRLHRLAREAGTYLGLEAGEPLPKEEVYQQAKAHDYDKEDVDPLLEQEGYGSQDFLPVPRQGDAFGELWRPSQESESGPESRCEPLGAEGDGTLRKFKEWCEERAESDKVHSYTRQKANRRYARGKDVDRSFVREYEDFSTILITYCRQRKNETLAEHAECFYPRQVTRKRRRILKREGVYQDYAGVSVLAPKSPDGVPSLDAPITHTHDFLWLPSHVEAEAFSPLRKVEGFDVHVSVEKHRSEEVHTPDSVKAKGLGLDIHRGDTTRLTQELGANLPLLNCRFDARGTPAYVEEWCAHLREGSDGSLSTQGVRRFREIGTFDDRADTMRLWRRLKRGCENAQLLTSWVRDP
jgi:hypothetical protein